MNIYNIKTQSDYNLSISDDSLKDSKSNVNFISSYYKQSTLPGTNIPVLFSNDRILKDSYIVTSDESKQTKLNDPVVEDKLAALLPTRDDIWKPTWRRIKNYGT